MLTERQLEHTGDPSTAGRDGAQVVNKTSPESLLDTYHAERHPVGARVLHNTMAQVALSRPDDRHQALRDTMTELLSMDEPRRRIAAKLSGLDIHDDLGEGHPLLARRMPDLDLHTVDGLERIFSLLHDARPVLLNLGELAQVGYQPTPADDPPLRPPPAPLPDDSPSDAHPGRPEDQTRSVASSAICAVRPGDNLWTSAEQHLLQSPGRPGRELHI